LQRIADYVRVYGYKVRLAGHTDNIGDDQANMLLSRNRAQAVRQQLIEYGCPAESIQAYGYGETKPVDTNDTETGRQNNRRVEITLMQ
jgi:OOP family OmpA-OmpF porin